MNVHSRNSYDGYGAKIEKEIKIQAIGFAIVLLRSAAHSTDVLSSFSAYPHISRPIRLVLSPVAELLLELLQTRYSATHASQTRFSSETERASTSCVVTPLLFVSCTVKGHA
jgi:hypothetical protein